MKKYCGLISVLVGIVAVLVTFLGSLEIIVLFNNPNITYYLGLLIGAIGFASALLAPTVERHTAKSFANFGGSINGFVVAFNVVVLIFEVFK